MTDEVAALVLRDNYRQNRALANARAQAASMEDVHARFIRALEQQGDLEREVERLPNDEELARPAGGGHRADRAGARRPARLRQDRPRRTTISATALAR